MSFSTHTYGQSHPQFVPPHETWFYPTTAQPSTLGVGQGGLELVILQLQ